MLNMPDLMITINAPASKKNGFVILETYYTKQVVVNTSGKYKGGSITAADVLNCIPINNAKHELIREIFATFGYQISLNSFYICTEDLRKLHCALGGGQLLFLDNTDKSLVLIGTICNNSIGRKPKHQYQVGNYKFFYYSDQSLSVERTGDTGPNIRQITPVPRLYFSNAEQVYSLFFDYSGSKIAYSDKRASITVGDMVYLRNFKFETETRELLLRERFVKLAQSRFVYSGHQNKHTLNVALFNNGIVLEDDENTLIPEIKVTRGDSGWFEIDLSCDIDGDVIDLASRIQLFASTNELEIGNKKICLPDSIIQGKNDLVFEGNKIKISQSHIFSLLRIIYDSGSRITDFFSYSDVKISLPRNMAEAAFPYQLEGIKWLKFLFLNHFGGCLADDMGLGKTFQIIAFLEDVDVKKKIQKVLVIAPKSLLTNWKKEFEKFSSAYRVGIYHGDKRNEFNFGDHDVIITTYTTALLDLEQLNHVGYSAVIFDEIQTIKNHKSITSETMKQIKAEIKIGLSGTPMENGISELWNIMDILNPGVFSSHASFLVRYNGRNYDELKTVLNLFILRRMKKDVLKELPPKREQIIYCDMDQGQRKLYTSINVAVRSAIMNLKAFAAPVVLKGLTLLRECCCHPLLLDDTTNVERIRESCKLDALKILAENLFESGHKILIFSNYTSMLQLIRLELEKTEAYREFIFYLDGQTTHRNQLVERFEASDSGIFLISIKAGGVGLNLVSAQDVIIYDPWWNPFVEQQAIDRAYRIGQQQAVSVYKLVVANTLEERIIDMQKSKEEDFDELINNISTDKNVDLSKILSLL